VFFKCAREWADGILNDEIRALEGQFRYKPIDDLLAQTSKLKREEARHPRCSNLSFFLTLDSPSAAIEEHHPNQWIFHNSFGKGGNFRLPFQSVFFSR